MHWALTWMGMSCAVPPLQGLQAAALILVVETRRRKFRAQNTCPCSPQLTEASSRSGAPCWLPHLPGCPPARASAQGLAPCPRGTLPPITHLLPGRATLPEMCPVETTGKLLGHGPQVNIYPMFKLKASKQLTGSLPRHHLTSSAHGLGPAQQVWARAPPRPGAW